MDTTTDWARSLSDADLMQHFGAATLVRGRQYAAMNRVGRVSVDADRLTATVRGDAMRTYTTVVSRRAEDFDTRCSCPVQSHGKHGAALLITLRDRSPGTDWRRALARFAPAQSGELKPLAVGVEQTIEGYVLRPMRPGSREPWVKSGISWDDLRRDSGTYDPDQRRALVELLDTRRNDVYSYAAGTGTFPLDRMRPEGWQHLIDAVRAGVTLVSGKDLAGRDLPPVTLTEELVTASVLVKQSGGGATVTPVLSHGGTQFPPPARTLQGVPAHGVALHFPACCSAVYASVGRR